MDNTRSFWETHKLLYSDAVKAPMVALTEALAAEFGTAKIFRPFRDVRFARDKTPYKTHQGAYVAVAPATGWYVQIGAPGVRVSGGFYHAEPADLARIRTAIDDDRTGAELEQLLKSLERKGFEASGETLKTSPRGYDTDHPRIELLRHKTLTMSRSYGFEPVIHTPELLDRVRKDWRSLRPLIEWVAFRAG
ncbi:MAG: DUF2461 domain-containing protein [Actinomycetota bacterium]|nr:DUF2461 domain-containing protein [Actinomycetota bacterium]